MTTLVLMVLWTGCPLLLAWSVGCRTVAVTFTADTDPAIEWCEGGENGYVGVSLAQNPTAPEVGLYTTTPPQRSTFICQLEGTRRVTVDPPLAHASHGGS